jgi:hypothetical protein
VNSSSAPHPFFSNHKVVVLLASLCCLLWGSAYPAIKNGYALFAIAPDDIPTKMLFAGYRFAFAGLLLLIMAAFTKRDVFDLSLTKLRQVTTLGWTQTSIQYAFFYVGLSNTTGVKGSIMNATGTFFSVLMAHFIYQNDRLSRNKVLGCLIGFAGVMVVNFNRELLDFHFTLLGEGFVVIAAFVLSAGTIYGKKNLADDGLDRPHRLSIDHRRRRVDCGRLRARRFADRLHAGVVGVALLSRAAVLGRLRSVDDSPEVQPRRARDRIQLPGSGLRRGALRDLPRRDDPRMEECRRAGARLLGNLAGDEATRLRP